MYKFKKWYDFPNNELAKALALPYEIYEIPLNIEYDCVLEREKPYTFVPDYKWPINNCKLELMDYSISTFDLVECNIPLHLTFKQLLILYNEIIDNNIIETFCWEDLEKRNFEYKAELENWKRENNY